MQLVHIVLTGAGEAGGGGGGRGGGGGTTFEKGG